MVGFGWYRLFPPFRIYPNSYRSTSCGLFYNICMFIYIMNDKIFSNFLDVFRKNLTHDPHIYIIKDTIKLYNMFNANIIYCQTKQSVSKIFAYEQY